MRCRYLFVFNLIDKPMCHFPLPKIIFLFFGINWAAVFSLHCIHYSTKRTPYHTQAFCLFSIWPQNMTLWFVERGNPHGKTETDDHFTYKVTIIIPQHNILWYRYIYSALSKQSSCEHIWILCFNTLNCNDGYWKIVQCFFSFIPLKSNSRETQIIIYPFKLSHTYRERKIYQEYWLTGNCRVPCRIPTRTPRSA